MSMPEGLRPFVGMHQMLYTIPKAQSARSERYEKSEAKGTGLGSANLRLYDRLGIVTRLLVMDY